MTNRQHSKPEPETTRPTSSLPYSPQDRTTRASSVFPYSTARPPTNYSQQSWLPSPSTARTTTTPKVTAGPPFPPKNKRRNSDSPLTDLESQYDDETPLYARSDWGSEEGDLNAEPPTTSAWSRSSFAGENTGVPNTGYTNGLQGIKEDDGDSQGRYSGDTLSDSGKGGGGEVTPGEVQVGNKGRFGSIAKSNRSTLPSVLDLEHLTTPKKTKTHHPKAKRRNKNDGYTESNNKYKDKDDDPFVDPDMTTRRRTTYIAQPTPSIEAIRPDTSIPFSSPKAPLNLNLDILSPSDQNRLGRMSQAQPRYSLPQAPKIKGTTPPLAREESQEARGWANKVKRHYMAYRPFISAGLSVICGLLLTIGWEKGLRLSRIVVVKKGVWGVSAGGDRDVGLGVSGWCTLGEGSTCSGYRDGDFANKGGTFIIPGNHLLITLYNLLIATTSLTWLLSAYLLTTAFLHFYLFFVLSLPFHHLVDQLPLSQSRANPNEPIHEKSKRESEIQGEVDIRVGCEIMPFESYRWVWWAWWAHRRGPLGAVFGVLVGGSSLVSFLVTIGLERSIAKATDSQGVSLGGGAMVPLVTFLLNLDTFQQGIRWFISAPTSWSTFTNPPDPSPAALMLPPSEKRTPLTRCQNSHGSFYAPPQTFHPITTTPINPSSSLRNLANPNPNSTPNLDPETYQWLVAYPKDMELVPLIADLRSGKENDDFILSDVGLLYLRPEEEGVGQALLVPPSGEIRRELIEDAHIGSGGQGEGGGGLVGIHVGVEEVLRELGGVFWWMNIEDDVRDFIGGCKVCSGEKGMDEKRLKPGMTPLSFTGVTGWTSAVGEGGWTAGPGESAMAAEMAFAMSKAGEDAKVAKEG